MPEAPSSPYLEAVLAGDRVRYARKVMPLRDGEDLFPWQIAMLSSESKRKIGDCSRQAGKSSVVAPIATHTVKYRRGSLVIVQASTLQQASWDMSKIKQCISRDPTFPKLVRESDSLIEDEYGGRIEVIPATEKSAQGASAPAVIILDEASDIDDEVVSAGVIPMLTGNEECELILISTPHGRTGFFFRAFHNPEWERYLVRSPFLPVNGTTLEEFMPEAQFIAQQTERGVKAWYSPRHSSLKQQTEQLLLMGMRLYLQEQCAEFVEPEEQIFSYDDIAAAANAADLVPNLSSDIAVEDIPVLE